MYPIPGLPSPTVMLGVAAAFVLSVGLAFGIGHHQGYAAEHDKFIAFQADVKAAGEAAEAKHKLTIAGHEAVTAKVVADSSAKLAALQAQADEAMKAQLIAHSENTAVLQQTHAVEKQSITEGIKNVYESKIAAIHAAYAGRLLGVNTNTSSGIVSSLSLSTPPAYDESSYHLLAANCAITTQMLISLQEWVTAEGAVQ